MTNAVNLASGASTGIGLVPSGVMLPYAGASAPTGWLLCDGSAVSRTTYAALFAAIGTAYGTGDGSTTFNLPNTQDRIPVGVSGTRARGTTGGASTVTLTTAQLPAHSHGVSDPGHAHGVADPGHAHAYYVSAYGSGGSPYTSSYSLNGGQGVFSTSASGSGIGIYGSTTNISIQNTGSGSPVSVEQPWVATNYIIKV